MYQKKSGFLAGLFSIVPGAGHMYLGLSKKGASLMALFFADCFLCSIPGLHLLWLGIPVIWFYSLFDAVNKSNLTLQQLSYWKTQDKFLFEDLIGHGQQPQNAHKARLIAGWGLVVLGVYAVFYNFLRPFLWDLYDLIPWLYDLLCNIPAVLFSLGLIALGVYLVRSTRQKAGKDQSAPGGPQCGQ
ncbi:hypothetical protein H8K20_12990 [Neobittarella massiliensis]|uniref:TM2 domain-containing protein n=2 Tax=Oscillospiraceae TaxID=216572 RepID=A0A8J6M286_9FIRM|nr:hypothetical protein [Neobittarella massiliensis]MBC3517306.1 hypothetical protein [Neobittarella massiliensis]SCJ75529.1 Uncharacterised protein [uncultured Anaerotruncus sp.]